MEETGGFVEMRHLTRLTQIHKKANSGLSLFAFRCIFPRVIRSFADTTTEKIFLGEALSRKESNKFGTLNTTKAFERLAILNEADERSLLLIPALHYHKLKGTSEYSIDAESRNSPWRITFQWENAEMKNVELVRIEDTH
jgi:plasmid maintenance system killer protein